MTDRPAFLAPADEDLENVRYLHVRIVCTTTERKGLQTKRVQTAWHLEPLAVRAKVPVENPVPGDAVYTAEDGAIVAHIGYEKAADWVVSRFSETHQCTIEDVQWGKDETLEEAQGDLADALERDRSIGYPHVETFTV